MPTAYSKIVQCMVGNGYRMPNLLSSDISKITSLFRNAVSYYHNSIKGPMIETSKEMPIQTKFC